MVGLKVDLRGDGGGMKKLGGKGLGSVSYEEGLQMAQEIGAVKYVESSALLSTSSLKAVFDEAIRAVVIQQQTPKKEAHNSCHLA
uniref:Uncharacterized protein n=1 Tax=Arcella intermedia TaxID=1963864 RepID=A0A6B2LT25_9EUKA